MQAHRHLQRRVDCENAGEFVDRDKRKGNGEATAVCFLWSVCSVEPIHGVIKTANPQGSWALQSINTKKKKKSLKFIKIVDSLLPATNTRMINNEENSLW